MTRGQIRRELDEAISARHRAESKLRDAERQIYEYQQKLQAAEMRIRDLEFILKIGDDVDFSVTLKDES